jgi:hypothetical protein
MAMFGLFKKKEKAQEKPVSAQAEEMRLFAGQFLSEEMEVLVLTGAGGFMSAKAEGDELYTAGVDLNAWMEADGEEIHKGNFRLVTKGDATLVGYMQQRMPRDFILKCTVRPHAEGKMFMLVGLPEPGFDPDLKAMLLEQKKPVTAQVEGLGEFTLNRSVGVLQKEIDWLGEEVQLCIDSEGDHALCASVALSVMEDVAGWDEKARACAADKLLEQVNADSDEEMGREEFMECLGVETLDVSADGSFQLWFNDGGLFGGSLIRVSGSAADGLTDAVVEG